MLILITGGTGLIGTHLIQTVFKQWPQAIIYVLTRQHVQDTEQVRYIRSVNELAHNQHFNTIFNLAGEPIAGKRWSQQQKQRLLDSRIVFTQILIQDLQQNQISTDVWVNASAVGFYGRQGSQMITETHQAHDEFTHQLCQKWEQAAATAGGLAKRICIVRLGLVIAAKGGFLRVMGRQVCKFPRGLSPGCDVFGNHAKSTHL